MKSRKAAASGAWRGTLARAWPRQSSTGDGALFEEEVDPCGGSREAIRGRIGRVGGNNRVERRQRLEVIEVVTELEPSGSERGRRVGRQPVRARYDQRHSDTKYGDATSISSVHSDRPSLPMNLDRQCVNEGKSARGPRDTLRPMLGKTTVLVPILVCAFLLAP